MKANKANLKRCGSMTIIYCAHCCTRYSASHYVDLAGYYGDLSDDYGFRCDNCDSEMVLGRFTYVFVPASPKIICVIHDQGDFITTWLVETEPDTDPLEAIYEDLFKGDEDWDDLKGEIEWFYLDPIAAMTLKDIDCPTHHTDSQHAEVHTVMATVYRAFKEGGPDKS